MYRNLLSDTRMTSIALVSFYATLGMNVASAALPAMVHGLAVSDAQIGLVVTVYSFAAMLFVPLSGAVADTYGRRTVLLPSILVFGLSGIAIAFVNSFLSVLVLRGFQGAAYAALMPLTVTLLGDLYSGSLGSAAQGLRVSMNGIGSSAIPVLAGFLAGYAWNYPFLIFVLVFPITLLTYLYIPETVDESARGSADTDMRAYLSRIRTEVSSINTSILVSGEGIRDFVRYALLTFVPLFAVRSLDASFAAAGSVLAARGIAYILISPMSGIAVRRFSRKQVLIGALFLSGGSIVAMPLASSVLWLALLLGLYTFGDSMFSPVIKDSVAGLASDKRRGGIISTMNLLKYGGQTVSPTFFGFVLAIGGFAPVFYIAAGVAVIYGSILFFTVNDI